MTSIDEIVRELRAIAGHAGHNFDAVERETIDQAASALARSRRMAEALRKVIDAADTFLGDRSPLCAD